MQRSRTRLGCSPLERPARRGEGSPLSSTSTPKTYDDLLEKNERLCQRLEEAEETIEALPRSVAIIDRRGLVLSCNVSFAGLLEKPQQSVIGAKLEDFLDDENRMRWLHLLQ